MSSNNKVAVLAIMMQNANEPLFLKDLKAALADGLDGDSAHMHQFVLHASLDMVREKQWHTQHMYLGPVESFRDNVVSAWVMANGTSLLLLHRGFSEPSVKAFLKTVHTFMLVFFMNPVGGLGEHAVVDANFEAKVLTAAAQVDLRLDAFHLFFLGALCAQRN